jgi:hypothetical protein
MLASENVGLDTLIKGLVHPVLDYCQFAGYHPKLKLDILNKLIGFVV